VTVVRVREHERKSVLQGEDYRAFSKTSQITEIRTRARIEGKDYVTRGSEQQQQKQRQRRRKQLQ